MNLKAESQRQQWEQKIYKSKQINKHSKQTNKQT